MSINTCIHLFVHVADDEVLERRSGGDGELSGLLSVDSHDVDHVVVVSHRVGDLLAVVTDGSNMDVGVGADVSGKVDTSYVVIGLGLVVHAVRVRLAIVVNMDDVVVGSNRVGCKGSVLGDGADREMGVCANIGSWCHAHSSNAVSGRHSGISMFSFGHL